MTPSQYREIHDAATSAYEAATPVDYRYSALALRKAVDAALEAASQFMPDAKGKETDLEGAVRNMIANRSSHFKARNGRLVSIEDDSGEHSWIVSFDDMAEIESALTPSSETDKEKGR